MGLAGGTEPPRKGEAGGLCSYSSTYGESRGAGWRGGGCAGPPTAERRRADWAAPAPLPQWRPTVNCLPGLIWLRHGTIARSAWLLE